MDDCRIAFSFKYKPRLGIHSFGSLFAGLDESNIDVGVVEVEFAVKESVVEQVVVKSDGEQLVMIGRLLVSYKI